MAQRRPRARAVLERADDSGYLTVIPVTALAEAIHTGSHPHDAPVNQILNQSAFAQRVAVDESIARRAAALRYAASGGEGGQVLLLDAFVAASAVATGEPAVILTSDPHDLERLVEGFPQIVVELA